MQSMTDTIESLRAEVERLTKERDHKHSAFVEMMKGPLVAEAGKQAAAAEAALATERAAREAAEVDADRLQIKVEGMRQMAYVDATSNGRANADKHAARAERDAVVADNAALLQHLEDIQRRASNVAGDAHDAEDIFDAIERIAGVARGQGDRLTGDAPRTPSPGAPLLARLAALEAVALAAGGYMPLHGHATRAMADAFDAMRAALAALRGTP